MQDSGSEKCNLLSHCNVQCAVCSAQHCTPTRALHMTFFELDSGFACTSPFWFRLLPFAQRRLDRSLLLSLVSHTSWGFQMRSERGASRPWGCVAERCRSSRTIRHPAACLSLPSWLDARDFFENLQQSALLEVLRGLVSLPVDP